MTTDLAVKQNPLRSLCFVIITVAGLISAACLSQHSARFIKGDDFAAGRADINAHQAHVITCFAIVCGRHGMSPLRAPDMLLFAGVMA